MLIALALTILSIPILLQRSVRAGARPGQPQPLDLGIFFAWVASAYGALPLLGIALAGWDIGAVQDYRLGSAVPEEATVARVGLMYLAFLVGFASVYGVLQSGSHTSMAARGAGRPSHRDFWIAIALLVFIQATMQVSRAALGIEQGEDYLATYLEFAGQPLIVQQLIGVLSASELSATILVIVVVLARNPRWHVWLGVLILLQIGAAIAGGGSRSLAFSCALAYIVARSIYDRRLRFSFVVIAGAFGLALFLLAGLIRQSGFGADVSGLYLLQGGEFLSIFYNSVDLSERLGELDNPALRAGIYAVDLLRLVPRQIVGELKLDPAAFYVSTFYPEFSEAGGGLAFGAIAESTIGFGAVEALVRGVILGSVYALVRNGCLIGQMSVLKAFIYTWFVVLSYQAIRDTTFSVFPRFLFQVVPLLIVLRALGALRGARAGGRRRHPRRLRPLGGREPTGPALTAP
jgi:hypothetical protein